MKIMLAASLLACAASIAVTAEAQPRRGASSPSIEGNWRVNFIIPMEATPTTPELVVSESDAKAVAACSSPAMVVDRGLDASTCAKAAVRQERPLARHR